MRSLSLLLLSTVLLSAADIERRQFRAVRVGTAPVIDGKLDDSCWQQSQVADDWRRFSEHTPAAEPSEARLLFDETALYLGVHCVELRMDLLRRDVEANPSTFNYGYGNTVEIFLDPGGSKERYWQFMINTNGATQTNLATRDVMHIGELTWEARVAFGPDHFTVEVAVPLAMLHLTPEAGTQWGLNFCRARQVGKKESADMYSSWQPMRGSFLQPAQFGSIVFDADLSRFFFDVSAPQSVVPGQLFRVGIANRTGAAGHVAAAVVVDPLEEEARRELLTLSLPVDGRVALRFGAFRPQDVGAEIRVTLTDATSGESLFIGATQTVDETR
ncbi:MAG: hypothetical protein HN742_02435 [Lentisphaerae bacterium]|mgnify:CR=1 FL=1|jgi:hypothetical protein|nr:hypothetical protein [Lentisphaerota bacterium]MBT4818965.1 hypothetical protein [Lentisphaerota bacterium]MBT5605312.1 hypothetical protein [Lentisphaerota bacterium]MBT7057538.1 hypothetical protein [Lentisphaerota bacterium]MBT7840696.1 hypothetical protein [Lentisphaerota bacterium]